MREMGTLVWLGGLLGASALALLNSPASGQAISHPAQSRSATAQPLAREPTAAAEGELTVERARAIIEPLYDALNHPADKDVDALLRASTTDDFRSCANEDQCGGRDYLAERFKNFGRIMPDLTWEMREVWVSGDKAFVLGRASATPIKPLFGAEPTGRGFQIMSLDMFVIRKDRMSFSYHVENWLSALQQIGGR